MDKFDLRDSYLRAFTPIAGKVFVLDPVVKVPAARSGAAIDHVDASYDRLSLLGTPIHMPCKIGNYELPNEPLIEIRGAKNIVLTQIDGMDGTFKELFSMGDYRVIIRGIITQDDGTDNYPDVDARRVRELCEARTELAISNELCNLFGINHVVIVDYEFGVIDGANGAQPYVLNCLSDKDIDIELKGV